MNESVREKVIAEVEKLKCEMDEYAKRN